MTLRFRSFVPYALAMAFAVVAPPHAQAQVTQKFVIQGGKLIISPEQQTMMAASQKVVNRDLAGAEVLYSQVLASNSSYIDAYLHRGVIRREMGNQQGAQADGQAAVRLADATAQQNPNSATAYYQRGMGYRLTRQFPQALADVRRAIQMGGNPDWRIDLRDITLEEKASHATY